MRIWLVRRSRLMLWVGLLVAAATVAGVGVLHQREAARATRPPAQPQDEVVAVLRRIFQQRAQALIDGSADGLVAHYDLSSTYGRWALEHERRRLNYIQAWADKRRLRLVSARSDFRVTSLRSAGGKDDERWASVLQSARLGYVYAGDLSNEKHLFGIGTRHAVQLVRQNGHWVLRRDWYTDPLDEDTLIPEVTPADVSASQGVLAPWVGLTQRGRCSPPAVDEEPSGDRAPQAELPNWLRRPVELGAAVFQALGGLWPFHGGGAQAAVPRYDRQAAVAYAATYCGAAWGCGNSGRYNAAYRDYTDLGGDCTNYVSQVLHAGGLPMDGAWYYRRGAGGSQAWLQTVGLSSYLVNSGRARLLMRGRFADVLRPTAEFRRGAIHELEPGDLIGYQEKGRIVHFAVVLGRDHNGYPVVNSHTADRHRTPWDLGWDQATTFWLFKMRDGTAGSR